jgi:hypothetical protein
VKIAVGTARCLPAPTEVKAWLLGIPYGPAAVPPFKVGDSLHFVLLVRHADPVSPAGWLTRAERLKRLCLDMGTEIVRCNMCDRMWHDGQGAGKPACRRNRVAVNQERSTDVQCISFGGQIIPRAGVG